MIWFVVGLLVGAAITSAIAYVYLRRQTEDLRRDLSYLRARLRSLARLTEFGLLKPESVEAANLLTQLQDLTEEPKDRILPSAGRGPADDDNDDVESIFRR